MYHLIVKRRIAQLFAAINAGDAGPVIDGFAHNFEHYFVGDHAFGGARRTKEATRAWYERLYRLLPDIHFTLKDVAVAGPPWNTIAYVRWREANSGTDGVRAEADGIHIVRLAWGKMTFLGIYPDTVALKATLDRLASKGFAEAHAAPIVS
jgi:ketosteroid isomerase-like protein